MSRKRLAGIIGVCAVAIIAAILLIHFEPWEGTHPVGTYSVTVASSGGGVVATPGEGVMRYGEGIVVYLVAEPEVGYRFVKWTGTRDVLTDEYEATTAFIMPSEDMMVIGIFEEKEPWWQAGVFSGCGEPVGLVSVDKDTYEIGEGIEVTFSGPGCVDLWGEYWYGEGEHFLEKSYWGIEGYVDGIWTAADVTPSRLRIPEYSTMPSYVGPGGTCTRTWNQTAYIWDADLSWKLIYDDELVTVMIRLTPFTNAGNLTGEEFKEAMKRYVQETQADAIPCIEEIGGTVMNTGWLLNHIVAKVKGEVLGELQNIDHFESWFFADWGVQVKPGIYRVVWGGSTAYFAIVDGGD